MAYDFLDFVAAQWSGLYAQAVAFLPRLAVAALVVATGLVVALLARLVLRRLFALLDRFLPNLRLLSSLKRVGLERPAGDILATIVFWTVLLVFVSSALDELGLPILSVWVQAVAQYLPRVLAALLIGLAGVVAGVLMRDAVSAAAATAGLTYGPVIGRLLQVTVLVISGLVAIDQIGLNVTVVSPFLIALVAATFLGAALAFGLGARGIVANILACHYVRRTFHVGLRVRVGQHEGEIHEITPTAVILSDGADRIVVPARLFVEEVAHLTG